MALGDGVRRNIRMVPPEERRRFVRALHSLQDGRSRAGGDAQYWFGRAQAHCYAHEHRGAEFLPWHRELCNRVEHLLRQVDPELSLHYWDWNQDPRDLFTPTHSVAGAEFGLPFDEAGAAAQVWRGEPAVDPEILDAPTFERLGMLLERKYAQARFVYFGGIVVNGHVSLPDPLAMLLHSNVDRLFAMWQARAGEPWRLDPARVYGQHGEVLENTFIEPWSTELMMRPWPAAERPQVPKTFTHASVVAPPCYDTLPARIVVDEIANPARVIRFRDVHAGRTFARAAAFRIFGRGNLTLRVSRGPTAPYSVVTPTAQVRAGHTPSLYQEVRLWFGYTGAEPGTAAPDGTVTIACDDTAEEFVFRLEANTAAYVPAAVASPSFAAVPEERPGVTWTWTWLKEVESQFNSSP